MPLFKDFPILDNFPPEVIIKIIEHLLCPEGSTIEPHVNDDGALTLPLAKPISPGSYISLLTTPSSSSSRWLLAEAQRALWLNPTKRFTSPQEFVAFAQHIIANKTPCAGNPVKRLRLAFSAEEFYAFFNASVPPFCSAEWCEADPQNADIVGRADLLPSLHISELVLEIPEGGLDPWFDTPVEAWDTPELRPGVDVDALDFDEEDPTNFILPRLRPGVCSRGLTIDWLVSYAWQRGYVRNVKKLTLDGTVQEWVVEKWGEVFKRRDNGLAFEVDLEAIETRGLEDGKRWEWDAGNPLSAEV